MDLTDPAILSKLGKLVITDLVLAGDNALVIALATRTLPERQRFWGRMFGMAGAVGLRVLFIALVAWLLKIPYLQLVGGAILIWIAWKLIQPQAGHGEEDAEGKEAKSLGQAIGIIILADITMSFDNVVAISSVAGDNIPLVVFGLLLSIPLVIWGSTLLAKLMDKFRWIVWLGGGILGEVAATIILKDPHVQTWLGADLLQTLVHYLPWSLAAVLFLLAWWLASRAAKPASAPSQPAA